MDSLFFIIYEKVYSTVEVSNRPLIVLIPTNIKVLSNYYKLKCIVVGIFRLHIKQIWFKLMYFQRIQIIGFIQAFVPMHAKWVAYKQTTFAICIE
jgi:hypothetical protein